MQNESKNEHWLKTEFVTINTEFFKEYIKEASSYVCCVQGSKIKKFKISETNRGQITLTLKFLMDDSSNFVQRETTFIDKINQLSEKIIGQTILINDNYCIIIIINSHVKIEDLRLVFQHTLAFIDEFQSLDMHHKVELGKKYNLTVEVPALLDIAIDFIKKQRGANNEIFNDETLRSLPDPLLEKLGLKIQLEEDQPLLNSQKSTLC